MFNSALAIIIIIQNFATENIGLESVGVKTNNKLSTAHESLRFDYLTLLLLQEKKPHVNK